MKSAGEESRETVEEGTTISTKLFLVLILGFAVVFVGIAVILVATVLYGSGSASVGAVIFIGPIPIVIGAGPDVTLMILFSMILAVLSIVVLLVMNRKIRRLES